MNQPAKRKFTVRVTAEVPCEAFVDVWVQPSPIDDEHAIRCAAEAAAAELVDGNSKVKWRVCDALQSTEYATCEITTVWKQAKRGDQ